MINDEWAGQFCGELNNDDLGLPIQIKNKKIDDLGLFLTCATWNQTWNLHYAYPNPLPLEWVEYVISWL